MAAFRVSTADVRKKAQELRVLNERFKAEVQALSSDVQRLNSMWEGEAKTAFMQAYSNDEEQFGSFYSGINQFIEALMEIADSYDRTEAQNTAIGQTRKA